MWFGVSRISAVLHVTAYALPFRMKPPSHTELHFIMFATIVGGGMIYSALRGIFALL